MSYSSSSDSSLYMSKWNRGISPGYSLTIVNVGLETDMLMPSPLASPRVKAVLPAPRSPYMATTAPGRRDLPKFIPCVIVSDSWFVMIFMLTRIT